MKTQEIKNARMEDFNDIVKNYKNQVFDTIYSVIGGSSDVDDIAQNVFLKIYINIGKFRGDSSLSTWIYRITVNTCMDELRKRKRKTVSLETELNESDRKYIQNAVVENFPDPHLRDSLQKALNSLPEKYRVIITLKEIDGLKYNEISRVMKISMAKVKVWLFRAREHLQEELSFLNAEVK